MSKKHPAEMLFEFLIAFVGLGVLCLFEGFTVSWLWEWFVVPIYKGIPSLTIMQAFGISIIVSCLTYQPSAITEEAKEMHPIKMQLWGFLLTATFLGMGWVAHFFV